MPEENIYGAAVEGMFPSPQGDPLPWYLDMAGTLPTYPASIGALAFRGSNTIIGGGWRQRMIGAAGPKSGYLREAFAQNNPLRPRNWMRHADDSFFHHTGVVGRRYTPFYGSAALNWMGRRTSDGEGFLARRVRGTELGAKAADSGMFDDELVTRGFFSRVTAGSRVGAMSEGQFAKNAGSIAQFLTRDAQAVAHAGGVIGPAKPVTAATVSQMGRLGTQQALLGSGAGKFTGKIGGFLAGTAGPLNAEAYSRFTPAAQAGARNAGLYAQNVGLAGKKITVGGALRGGAASGYMGQGAALAGGAAARVGARAIPVVGWAWLAYDLTRMGVKGTGHMARLGVDAARSFEGGFRVGIMEQGFKDNEATMTSRARGVQAIANSRLNARSVLGTEAGAMYSHFR